MRMADTLFAYKDNQYHKQRKQIHKHNIGNAEKLIQLLYRFIRACGPNRRKEDEQGQRINKPSCDLFD